MGTDYRTELRQEFEAADGSFLLRLRCQLEWDGAAFSRLVTAMEACCQETAGADSLERWQAELFWYIPDFVRSWTTHPNFPRVHPEEYYEQAYQRLDDLAFWYFMGESPYEGDAGFPPI